MSNGSDAWRAHSQMILRYMLSYIWRFRNLESFALLFFSHFYFFTFSGCARVTFYSLRCTFDYNTKCAKDNSTLDTTREMEMRREMKP